MAASQEPMRPGEIAPVATKKRADKSSVGSTDAWDEDQASGPVTPSIEFIWKVHDYTNNYIRFADTKAALVIVVASGLTASLYAAQAHHYFRLSRLSLHAASGWATLLGVGSLLAFLCLGGSIFLAVLAVVPRLRLQPRAGRTLVQKPLHSSGEQPVGYVFWRSILACG